MGVDRGYELTQKLVNLLIGLRGLRGIISKMVYLQLKVSHFIMESLWEWIGELNALKSELIP